MFWPARSDLTRGRTSLLLIATFVPCVVLVALGWRMIEQEQQLQEKQTVEERARFVVRVRQELLSKLEQIKLQEVTRAVAQNGSPTPAPNPGIAFVGPIVSGALELPWERTEAARRFSELVSGGRFAESISQAEILENAKRDYTAAVEQYRSALAAAEFPQQEMYGRLLLGRALQKGGRRQESSADYERVLQSPVDIVDEHNVPLGLYAAEALVRTGFRAPRIAEWIRASLDRSVLFPPEALYMARHLGTAIEDSSATADLDRLIHDREQAQALQRDLARVLAFQTVDPIWTAYGDPVWLIGVSPRLGNLDGLIVAVRADDALKSVGAMDQQLQLAVGGDQRAESLGENFPGLRVILPPISTPTGGARQALVASALTLAIALTLLAGYLLRRDVQRNLRLAELRSQFVSSVTHELKTPLTAIRMFTETLRLDDDVDRATRMEYLDTIQHESERLSRLVDNVLDFGKIERGKKTYRFQSVRLEQIVEQAARAAQYPLEQAGFTLEVVADPDLPSLHADPDALQQAILNLLTNAMKYSADSRRIGLRLERSNGRAHIRVIDYGIGIAADEQTRIFDSFYRSPAAQSQQIPGTGLGLTIVAHIAKAHGGDVAVESALGQGSAFTISLPLAEGGAA